MTDTFKIPRIADSATVTINGVINPDLVAVEVQYREGRVGVGRAAEWVGITLQGGPQWRYRVIEWSVDVDERTEEVINVELTGAELLPESDTPSSEYRRPKDHLVTQSQSGEIAKLNTHVDMFARRMKAKLIDKVVEGFKGWDEPGLDDSIADRLWQICGETNDIGFRGQEVDIANLAMFLYFLHQKEEATNAK